MKYNQSYLKKAAITTALLTLVTACDDKEIVQTKVVQVAGKNSLTIQSAIPSGSEACVFGGVLFSSGLDANSNGTLEDSEINQSNTVCQVNARSVLDPALVSQGKDIFRFDTFGDEQLWTDTLKINQVIESAVSPVTALSVGLKVDSSVLPEGILSSVDLNDPATTLALIGLNAVVGIQGTVENIDGVDRLTKVGITCALCHSDVDDSVMEGIGKRLDGHANRDINPGLILSLSPADRKSVV